ncbi:MAG: hypothetical protein B5M48_02865 [Candidatus Omnitrophica bacterium 4484_213]|nr:MAG: hypothetical protein B5M48_02865 [Candidatus Omnitrophica bacterium 4484_213]
MIKFQIESKLEKKIRITEDYWKVLIEIGHPSIADYEEEIKNALINRLILMKFEEAKEIENLSLIN